MIPSFHCILAGVLNFREFVTGLSLSLRGSFDEKLYWSFNIYDVDGNGFISREEMNEIIAVNCGISGMELQQIFYDEVIHAMWKICKEEDNIEFLVANFLSIWCTQNHVGDVLFSLSDVIEL